MGYMEAVGTSSSQLFGLTTGNEYSGQPGKNSYVWRVELDPVSGNAVTDASKFKILKLQGGGFNDDDQFVGLGPAMEYDNSTFYLHAITNRAGSDRIRYMKLSPDMEQKFDTYVIDRQQP